MGNSDFIYRETTEATSADGARRDQRVLAVVYTPSTA